MLYVNDHLQDFDLALALQQLSGQRREQALKYRYEMGQRTCAAAYLLLCRGLREEYGITELPIFEYDEHGKPSIVGHPEIHFNLSHCREAAVCIISDHPVGVDVESVRPLKDSKRKVAESVEHFLANFQAKVNAISDADVEKILEKGEKYANEVANTKLHQVQKAVGVRK